MCSSSTWHYYCGSFLFLFQVSSQTVIYLRRLKTISRPSTGASMNPARTIGPAIATGRYTKIWVYLVAQPLGAIAGAGSYVAIKL